MLEIGGSLREARRRRNLELTEVEKATRIRVQQLEALEREQFDLLPPDPYRRSFLREYADFLGLDGDLYVSAYDLRFRAPELGAPPSPPRGSVGALLGRRAALAIAGIALVALVGVAVWQLGGGGGGTAPPTLTTTVAPTRSRPRSRAPSPARATAPPLLVFTAARGNCWLWVRLRSTTGKTVYEQTLQPGQRVRFGLRRRLWIRVGAPWNLDASIGRRPVTLPAHTGNLLATAAGLRPAP
jgi:cytoskeleton protein RodZ